MTDIEWAYVSFKGFLIFFITLATIGYLIGTIENRTFDFKDTLKFFICIIVIRAIACLVQLQ